MASQPSTPSRAGAAVRMVAGVALGLAAGALLAIASFAFAFFGYCEEYCDEPDRSFLGALGAAAPWAVAGLVLLTLAVWLFMEGRRQGAARPVLAIVLAVASSVLLTAGLWGLVAVLVLVQDELNSDPLIIGLIVLGVVWMAATILASRRAAQRHPRPGR